VGKSALKMGGDEIDPMQAPTAAVNRRAFVRASTAAATVAASTPHVLAQEPTVGGAHPPLAPEDSPLTPNGYVELKRPDGTIRAYLATPAGLQPLNVSSVVVVMHVWGVDTSIRDVVRRLALAGFWAIAPDLYGRFGAPNGDGATDSSIFRPYRQRLERTQYTGDIRAAAMWLKDEIPQTKAGTKVGIIGFCMGGHIVLQQTIDNADVFDAAAPFYGAVDAIDPALVRVPVCGSYGARDASIPADRVRAFFSALKVPNQLKIYDESGHAFFDDQRPSYVASAADDAWTRTLAFFGSYLAPTKSS
jgi:carboxymethylenebutenolidase